MPVMLPSFSMKNTPMLSKCDRIAFKLLECGFRAPRSKSATVCAEISAAVANSRCVIPASARAALQTSGVNGIIKDHISALTLAFGIDMHVSYAVRGLYVT